MTFNLKHIFAVITAICLFLGGFAAGKDDFDRKLERSEYWRNLLQESFNRKSKEHQILDSITEEQSNSLIAVWAEIQARGLATDEFVRSVEKRQKELEAQRDNSTP